MAGLGAGSTHPHGSSSPAFLGQTCPILPRRHRGVLPHPPQLTALSEPSPPREDRLGAAVFPRWRGDVEPPLPPRRGAAVEAPPGQGTHRVLSSHPSLTLQEWASPRGRWSGGGFDHQSLGVWTPAPRTPGGRSVGAAECSEWPTLSTRGRRVGSPQRSEARPPGRRVSTRAAPSAFLLPRGLSVPPGTVLGWGQARWEQGSPSEALLCSLAHPPAQGQHPRPSTTNQRPWGSPGGHCMLSRSDRTVGHCPRWVQPPSRPGTLLVWPAGSSCFLSEKTRHQSLPRASLRK